MVFIFSEMNEMKLIEWRDEFKIGIDEVDFEHQELIDLINVSFSEADKKESNMVILYFLGDIYSKISAHFALEEKHMKELGYDQYEDHKQDHERLLDDIMNIMDDYRETANLDKKEFGERLSDWFTQHFKTKDARLHKFIK
jgi:hemerythrin